MKICRVQRKNLFNNPLSIFSALGVLLGDVGGSLGVNLNRYFGPFRYAAKTIFFTMFVLLAILFVAVIIVTVIPLLGLNLISKMIRGAINLLTQNQFSEELKHEIELNFSGYKSSFLNEARAKHPEALGFDEEQFFEYLTEQEVGTDSEKEQALNEKIKNNVQVGLLTEIKLVTKSLFRAIFKPLSEVQGNKLVSLLLTPLQLLAFPFLFVATCINQFLKASFSALLLVSSASLMVVFFINLVAINIPLFAIDFGRYIINSIKSCFVKDPNKGSSLSPNSQDLSNDQAQTQEHTTRDSPRVLSDLLRTRATSPAVVGSSDSTEILSDSSSSVNVEETPAGYIETDVAVFDEAPTPPTPETNNLAVICFPQTLFGSTDTLSSVDVEKAFPQVTLS